MNPTNKLPMFRATMLLGLIFAASSAMAQTTFTINALGDSPDNDPGDGICSTGTFIGDPPPFVLECTLRAALEEANASSTPATIELSESIPRTIPNLSIINVGSPLPTITSEITLAGDTHPDWEQEGATHLVLRGTNSGAYSGLTFQSGADGSTVRSIGIERFGGNGILIQGGDGYTIESNILGGSWNPTTYAYSGNDANGLSITGSSSNLINRNMILANGANGVLIQDGAASNALQGNVIGLRRTAGSGPFRPEDGNGLHGIVIFESAGQGNSIGFLEGNTISNNGLSGILVRADSQLVLGNRIGTPHDGEIAPGLDSADYGNGLHGIQVIGSDNIIGAQGSSRNLIGHSGENGIVVGSDTSAAADGNEIGSNWIGVNADGDDLGMEIGIQILSGANSVVSNNRISNNQNGFVSQGEGGAFIHGNTITDNQFAGAYFAAPGQLGPLDPGQSNIIGNNYIGVLVQAYETANTTALVLVRNNFIGTDDSGAAMGNEFGIVVETEFNRVEIGQSNDTGNTIANNETGIFLNGAHDTQVVGNLIGVHPNGAPMGNGTAALILSGSIGNQFGYAANETIDSGTWSPGTATGNVIAHNDAGIRFSTLDDSSYGNTIRGNQFHANGSTSTPGIDLGMTALDVGGSGTGPNTLLNYPDFDANATSWNQATGQLDYRFRVQTTPANADYPMTIDFYLTDGNSPQGRTYIGSETYPESASFEFRTGSLSLTQPVTASTYLVATTTDASGNTSQFTHQPFPLIVSGALFSDRFEGP